MQNILDIQNDLKNTSDEHLVQLMQMPEPNFPQYLVLSEMDRRKEMRESYEASQASQPTVAQQLTQETANSGVTQGLGSLDAGSVRGAEMISNATDMPVIYGNRPITSMANGGRTGYKNIGQVQQSHEERNPEQENFWVGKDGVLFDTDNPVDYALAATMAIPVAGWLGGGAAKLTLIGGRLVQKGIQAALPSIQRGIGSFASKRGFIGNYGGSKSIPLEQYGAQYIRHLGSKVRPYLPFGGTVTGSTYPTYQTGKFLTHTVPIAGALGYGYSRLPGGEDEDQIPVPFEVDSVVDETPETLPPPSDRGGEEIEETIVDTQEAGRRDDINTALVSLARIASAKPNELGNVLASAGKDVATAKRERRRDDLTERLTEAQIKAYEAKEGDVYQKAFFAAISAGDAFDKLSMDKKLRYSSSGKLETPADVAEARENYIKAMLQPQGLLEAYFTVSTQGSYGGGAGKTTSAQSYLSS